MRRAALPLLAIAGGVLAGSASATEFSGKFGYIGEWKLEATVSERSRGLIGREFAGTYRMQHLAMCSPGEVPVKSGRLVLSRLAPARSVTGTISWDDLDCAFSGPLSEDEPGMVQCPGKPPVPLYLWTPAKR